jgi:hypothetical protein
MYNIPVSALQHIRGFSEPFASAWTYYDRGVGSFVRLHRLWRRFSACSPVYKYLPLQMSNQDITVSYGHRTVKTRLPVRSAIFKHCIARLVLWWVTTWESLVL